MSVTLTREGALGRLTLDRPDKRNAITQAMWEAIPRLLAEAEADRALLVLIVSGARDHFAAGADIAEFPVVYATPESARVYSDAVQAAGRALAAFSKPTIAEIRGACVGGGAGLALACDLRFADPTTRMGITPGKLGLAYTLADTKRLVDAVGPARAKDILFSGRLVEGQEALRIGMVDFLEPADGLTETVRAYAQGLEHVSQFSIRAMKATINAIVAGQSSETQASYGAYLEGFQGDDFKEGYAAFLGKRPARFTAR
jgi:enoyl-CoA hydratase/carnithine racemase